MSLFEVREARPEEHGRAGEVVVRAYLTLEVFAGGHPGAVAYLGHVRDVRDRARECRVLVAVEADGTILGCVTYVPDHGGRFAELELPGEAGFRMLGVAPEAMGRGVGRALVEACIALAREADRSGIAISTCPGDGCRPPPLRAARVPAGAGPRLQPGTRGAALGVRARPVTQAPARGSCRPRRREARRRP